MTTETFDRTIELTTAQAKQVGFLRVLVVIFSGLFYCAGFAAGRLWLGAVFCALLTRQGWREGQGKAQAAQASAAPGASR